MAQRFPTVSERPSRGRTTRSAVERPTVRYTTFASCNPTLSDGYSNTTVSNADCEFEPNRRYGRLRWASEKQSAVLVMDRRTSIGVEEWSVPDGTPGSDASVRVSERPLSDWSRPRTCSTRTHVRPVREEPTPGLVRLVRGVEGFPRRDAGSESTRANCRSAVGRCSNSTSPRGESEQIGVSQGDSGRLGGLTAQTRRFPPTLAEQVNRISIYQIRRSAGGETCAMTVARVASSGRGPPNPDGDRGEKQVRGEDDEQASRTTPTRG